MERYLRAHLRNTYGYLRGYRTEVVFFDLFGGTYGCTYGWLTGTYGYASKTTITMTSCSTMFVDHLRITYGRLRACRKNDDQNMLSKNPLTGRTYGYLRDCNGGLKCYKNIVRQIGMRFRHAYVISHTYIDTCVYSCVYAQAHICASLSTCIYIYIYE